MDGLVEAVKKLGFVEEHVKEAMSYCGTKEEMLDWLCLHVPEDDLPQKFRPNLPAFETLLSDPASHAREYKARRLASFGFRRSDCIQALVKSGDTEIVALRRLVDDLVGSSFDASGAPEPGECAT